MVSQIYPLAHLTLALVEGVLLVQSVRLYRQSTSLAMIVLPIVLVGLSYDNLILFLGRWLGEGEFLESLSRLRFLLHYLTVPLFLVIAVELAHRAGAAWAGLTARVSSWGLALGLAGVEIATHYIGLELIPVTFDGLLRYTVANVSGVPVVTIVLNFFLLLVGIGLWWRLNWPWLLVGAVVSLMGNAIPVSLVGPLAGSVSEFLLALSLLFTEQRTQAFRAQLAMGNSPA